MGSRWMVGRWVTFPDFLIDYVKGLFEADWGNAEIAKPEGVRHPLIVLYQRVCAMQQHARVDVQEGVVVESPVTGAASLFFSLAYNLYCIEHNARKQPNWRRWIHRFKTGEDFYATCYEAYAAASFIRAGFLVDFLDEGEPGKKPEFLAFLPATGKTLAVECKRRAHEITDKNNEVGQLNRAFDQNRTGHTLVAFIELARPFLYEGDGSIPEVLRSAIRRIERHAATPLGQQQEVAYIMLTNQSQVHFLESGVGQVGYLHGYKIPELRFRETGPLEELLASRDAHPEIFRLLSSMQRHNHVPNTFDASEPRNDAGLRTPLDCFDFYWDAYRHTPRHQLLEWMAGWPERAELDGLDQSRLARRFASHFACLHAERIQAGRLASAE
ncbi:hypothetical protein [Stenotrophomonas sp.]|uniref:hypothetical protein n=1 Tax=Stenotrophomonas sp. TaxID=69392 RepID=UPI0028A900E9|nr:hypothetical protein [Stenotrophomonas sp.]